MRLSIAQRFVLIGAVGALAVGVVALAAAEATTSQRAASDRMARVSQGMSEQWNADMMHDAIRGDVMSALVARTQAEREELGAVEIADHGPTMIDRFDRAAALAPAGLVPRFTQVRPRIEAYVALAGGIIDTAATDRSAAQARVPEFLALAGELEESLGAIDEAMEQAVVAERDAASAAGGRTLLTITVAWVLASALFVGLCWVTSQAVLRPLRRMRAVLGEVSGGNFLERVRPTSTDELGDLGRSLDATLESVQEAFHVVQACIADITGSVEDLRRSSTDLSGSAAQTSTKAGEAVELATHVSDGAQEVASGIEQVSAQTRDIAGSAGTAADVGRRAVDGADAASRTITRLGDSSSQISGVAAMIRSIADQTRLLALNATIEAARAGEAGRGFAVVANEVKDLAQEVGRATEDISSRIASIQSEVEEAVADIGTVSRVIGEINAHQHDIATAVEAQARSSTDVASVIDVAARDASGIVGSVMVIASAAEQTSNTAERTAGAASGLAQTAERMRTVLAGYRF
ncbi:MAG: methyl-accepting chemotaxis protein [Actinobacteria bacterium]|nr:methyl-accepting chemotaxis protein [Actinomycetota bacterium]